MKRVGRWMLNGLALLSLLLCVATVGLWIRSYSGADSISRRWMTSADATHMQHRGQEVQWTRGRVRFLLREDTAYFPGQMTPDAAKPKWFYFRYGVGYSGELAPAAQDAWARLGFAEWRTGWMSSFADENDRVWSAPSWAVALTFGFPPGYVAWRLGKRRHRRSDGLCPRCRYDLTGNVSGVCPECGRELVTRRA